MLDVVVLNAFFKMCKLFDRKCIPKENGNIKRNINSATKKMLIYEISIIMIFNLPKIKVGRADRTKN